MPKVIRIRRRVNHKDKIEGSNQMARAVWALGAHPELQSAADISRVVQSRTELNWEGPQVARFFRLNYPNPHFDRVLMPNGRYRYSLSEFGQKIFNATFVASGPEMEKQMAAWPKVKKKRPRAKTHTAIRATGEWRSEVQTVADKFGISRNAAVMVCSKLGLQVLKERILTVEQIDALLKPSHK